MQLVDGWEFYVLATSKVISGWVLICDIVHSCQIFSAARGGELAQLVRGWGYVTMGTWVRIQITAVTFSFAAIHFLTVYNLQLHQRPVPLIPSLYGVGG